MYGVTINAPIYMQIFTYIGTYLYTYIKVIGFRFLRKVVTRIYLGDDVMMQHAASINN